MFKKLVNSLKRVVSGDSSAPAPRRSPVPVAKSTKVPPQPAVNDKDAAPKVSTRSLRSNDMHSIDSLGPGKNVLVKNRYVREDTGTHETLKIVDESLLDSTEEGGIDPYNTGAFDRSKNWSSRSRK